MKKIEITYSNSAKINKGNYEQEAPMFSAKSMIEFSEENPISEKEEFSRLKSIVDPLLAQHILETKQIPEHIRIREFEGQKYPSVNSILKPEKFECHPDYAVRGTEIERIVRTFLKTGVWIEPEKQLSKIKYSDIKYKETIAKYKSLFADVTDYNVTCYNKKLRYSGECDAIGKLRISNVRDIIDVGVREEDFNVIYDFKTGQYDLTQLIAYAECDLIEGHKEQIDMICVIDLKNCAIDFLMWEDNEWSDKFNLFCVKRGEFKQRFGI